MPTPPVIPKLPDPPLRLPEPNPGIPIDPAKVRVVTPAEPEVKLYAPPAVKHEPPEVIIADESAGEEQANA